MSPYERSSPRQLWQSIDDLMGRGRVPTPSTVDAMTFHQHFDAKVANVRATTADAPPPSFTPSPPGCLLAEFRLLTVADVTAAVRALPDKRSASDPIPTSLLKSCIDVLSPFLVQMFNRSLLTGSVPTIFKIAYTSHRCRRSPSWTRAGCTFIQTDFQPVVAVQAA